MVWKKLLVATTRPFSWLSLRCWMKAYSGTTKSPLAIASSTTAAVESAKEWRAATSASAKNPMKCRAHRHQAELHLVAGEAAGHHIAHADADREEGPQQRDPVVADLEHFGAEVLQVGLQQHAGEPEVAHAEHGQPERLVVEQVARAAGDLAEGIPAEDLLGAGGRHARDLQARRRSR